MGFGFTNSNIHFCDALLLPFPFLCRNLISKILILSSPIINYSDLTFIYNSILSFICNFISLLIHYSILFFPNRFISPIELIVFFELYFVLFKKITLFQFLKSNSFFIINLKTFKDNFLYGI